MPVKQLVGIFALVLIWSLLYWDALLAMEATWRRSDTFAHGYFIAPISAWLIWRQASKFKQIEFASSWLALPLLLLSLAVGLLAFAVDIAVLRQLSAIASLISLLWLLLGNQFFWQFKFALLFLFFAVPMGENLIPWLQDVTAWISVFLLKVHGIPTFRDGLYIQTSSGLFEVAVACSGIRYLIASLAVGTLYAHLTYQKTAKQLAFIVFAIVLPIIANGIRAYLIIIIAHYSEMEYATGVDHLVYGWVFFGFVIMLMFYIGGKFADAEESVNTLSSTKQALTKNHFKPLLVVLSGAVLLINYWLLANMTTALAPQQALTALSGKAVNVSDWGINYQNALRRSHISYDVIEGANIELFRAVYAHKQNRGELINSLNHLYDQEHWTIFDKGTVEIANQPVNWLHLHNPIGQDRFVYYWYSVAGQVALNDHETKLKQALASILAPQSRAEITAISIVGINKLEQSRVAEHLYKTLPELVINE